MSTTIGILLYDKLATMFTYGDSCERVVMSQPLRGVSSIELTPDMCMTFAENCNQKPFGLVSIFIPDKVIWSDPMVKQLCSNGHCTDVANIITGCQQRL